MRPVLTFTGVLRGEDLDRARPKSPGRASLITEYDSPHRGGAVVRGPKQLKTRRSGQTSEIHTFALYVL